MLAGPKHAVLRALSIIEDFGPSLGIFIDLSKCKLCSHSDISMIPHVMKASHVPHLDIRRYYVTRAFLRMQKRKNDWSDFTALCIFYVSVNVKYGMKLIGLNFLTCLDVRIFEKSSRLCRMDRKHLYRYCEHCEEFVSARTFLRHKEAYYDDHTRIWSKNSQSAPLHLRMTGMMVVQFK